MSASHAKAALVASGHEPGVIPWPLLGFLLLSAFLHAFGFFIFQIVYPPVARIGPPPVQVSLLAPGTPETDAILRWIDSEDPALAAEPGHAPIPGLTSLPYVPSYATVRARPAMAPSTDQPLADPEGVGGIDLVKMAASHPAPPPPPPAAAATLLSFSGALKDSPLDLVPALDTLHEGDLGELQPATYLLAVSDQGEVRYVFLQDSSGDKTLDAAADHLLKKILFHPLLPPAPPAPPDSKIRNPKSEIRNPSPSQISNPLPSPIRNPQSAIRNTLPSPIRNPQSAIRNSPTPLTWGFATFYWGPGVYAHPSPAPSP